MLEYNGDILGPLAERRNAQAHSLKAIKLLCIEAPCLNDLLQVTRTPRDQTRLQPRIEPLRHGILQTCRQCIDLIQKQRPFCRIVKRGLKPCHI